MGNEKLSAHRASLWIVTNIGIYMYIVIICLCTYILLFYVLLSIQMKDYPGTWHVGFGYCCVISVIFVAVGVYL